jgi:protein TBF1
MSAKMGSRSRMKVESLPILDNLVGIHLDLERAWVLTMFQATQVLSNFAKSTYQETVTFTAEHRSEAGQEYAAIRHLFETTKGIYKSKTSFLSASELGINDATQIEVLRKANLATFVSTIFEPREIGFADLDTHFLEIFVPNNGRLLKAQAQILLELKTQAFIAATRSKDSAKEDLLHSLFPDNLESRILTRRPGARGLAPSEQEFVKRALSRREFLLAEIKNDNLDALPEKYRWEDFLREISSYVGKNFDAINSATVSIKYRN